MTGISPAAKARLFNSFSQADSTITRRFGGTGLGLAISKDLSELMGGTLDCRSRPGEGATFWFDLPLPECAAPTPLEAANAPAANGEIYLTALAGIAAHEGPGRVATLHLDDVFETVGVNSRACNTVPKAASCANSKR